MSDSSPEFDYLQRAMRRASRSSDGPATACLNEEEMAAFIDGVATSDARDRAIAHLADCASCRAIYVDLTETLARPEVVQARPLVAGGDRAAAAGNVTTRSGWRPRSLAITGLAAAALLFVMLKPRSQGDEPLRDDAPSTLVTAPTAVSPRGPTRTVPAFEWKRMEGAELYRITVFEVDGVVVWEGESADTTLVLPDVPVLRSGETYLWRVQARTAYNRWTSSELVEFRVADGDDR